MYINSEELDECLKTIEDGEWDWFLDLKHPGTISAKYKANRYENPEEGFAVWIDEIGREHRANSYVRVIERRENHDVLFHVLLSGVPERLRPFWKRRWWELTAGSGFDRSMEKPIEGLFKYFVFTKRCDIECSAGGSLTEFRWPEHE
jgi:hypothetical protein